MAMKHVISVLVENHFGVLARVSSLFRARGYNIDSLCVGTTLDVSVSLMTVVVEGDDKVLAQIVKQLNKLVNVVDVEHFVEGSAAARELILLKVNADSKTRPEIMQICDIFRAKVIDVNAESVIVEVTGNANKIRAFLDLVEPFGIQKMARTGIVALERGPSSIQTPLV